MKHFLRSLFAGFLAISTIFMFVACSDIDEVVDSGKTLEGIYVSEIPLKYEYEVGEKLDTTGLQVIAFYSDGSEADVTESCEITGFDSSKEGWCSVTITYTEESTTVTDYFEVNIESSEENPNLPDSESTDSGSTEDDSQGEDSSSTGDDSQTDDKSDEKSIEAGDIILSDGTIVKKDNYTSIDSGNPPVAVVIKHSDYNNVTLGIGLYTSTEPLAFAPIGTKGHDIQYSECEIYTLGSDSKYSATIVASVYANDTRIRFGGYTNGNYAWDRIYNFTYKDTETRQKYLWELFDSKTNFPAFYWVNSYGETYKEYLGEVTYGWYIPSIVEMAEIYRNIEKINESLTSIQNLNSNYSGGAISGEYLSSNETILANTRRINYLWHINLGDGVNDGLMRYDAKDAAYKVLAVRSFKNDSTEAELSSIAITRAPEKIEYVVNSGTEIDTTGLKVTAYYSDYTTKDVTENITMDAEKTFDLSTTAKTQEITISYSENGTEKLTKFPIAVVETPTQYLRAEVKEKYVVGDVIDMKVTLHYDHYGYKTKDITNDVTVTGFDTTEPTAKEPKQFKNLTISYTTEDGTVLESGHNYKVYKYAPGSIVLSDGSIVSKDDYTFDENNLPVAVVAGTTSTNKVLAVGLYSTNKTTEYYQWSTGPIHDDYEEIKCNLCHDEGNAIYFEGDLDGSDNVDYFSDYISNYPAFVYANSYGETFKDYLGAVTDGWYLPSIFELYTVRDNLEAITEATSSVYNILYKNGVLSDNNNFGISIVSDYWSSSLPVTGYPNVYALDFYKNEIGLSDKTNNHSILVVHSFE